MNKSTLVALLGLTALVGCAAETAPTDDVEVKVQLGDEKTDKDAEHASDQAVVDAQCRIALKAFGVRPTGCGDDHCW